MLTLVDLAGFVGLVDLIGFVDFDTSAKNQRVKTTTNVVHGNLNIAVWSV